MVKEEADLDEFNVNNEENLIDRMNQIIHNGINNRKFALRDTLKMF